MMMAFISTPTVSRVKSQRSGRTVLLIVAISAVVIGAVFGYVIGLVAPGVFGHIQVASVVRFHPTPSGLATYGALMTAVVLGGLFGAVQFVSRYDTDAR
ncbi:DUF7520 family protein [Halomarina litorea]|uniref:DUF7520 family protein n=1 Tax=Halomarina litorea TaxID=2961595 RepID=UPI0020C2F6C0|nr:hypothetical protein [Halomarina sp. BCD28]